MVLPHSPQHLHLYLEISTLLNQLISCFPLFLYLSSSPYKAGTRASGLAHSPRADLFHRGSSRWVVVFFWHLPFPGPLHHVSSAFQPTQDLFPGLSIRTEKNRCLFFSSLNLEKVGSFLVHFCVLELVSQLSNCAFISNLLSSLPSFFFLFFFSCCFIDMWHIYAH